MIDYAFYDIQICVWYSRFLYFCFIMPTDIGVAVFLNHYFCNCHRNIYLCGTVARYGTRLNVATLLGEEDERYEHEQRERKIDQDFFLERHQKVSHI
jgi:hypothetical protein